MERIKHLLILLVFLLGVTSVTQAQMRAPSDSDLDFSQISLTLSPVSLTSDIEFTGCALTTPIEIRLSMVGETGTYSGLTDPNTGYNGKPQNVPLCFRLFYKGGAVNDVDILGLGNTILDNTNPATMGGYVIAQDETTGEYTGSVIIYVDPTMIVAVGSGTYTVEAYYCGDDTKYSEKADLVLTSTYGVDLEVNDLDLYVGCVKPPALFSPFGEFDPNCTVDPKLVVKYKGGATDDIDVIELAKATPDSLILDIQNYNPATGEFDITGTDIPTAMLVGCGTYTAYIAIDLGLGAGYVQASENADFQICAEYPYELISDTDPWIIYKYEKEKGCDYNINRAFRIYGPGEDAAKGWTENGPVKFIFWSEDDSEVFDLKKDVRHEFPAQRYGNYNLDGSGNHWGRGQSVARRNFPDVIGTGCETFVGQLVCYHDTDIIVSDTIHFTISVKYPVAAKLDKIDIKMDPVCPGYHEFNFDLTNALCDPAGAAGSMTPVRFELELVDPNDDAVLGDLIWSVKYGYPLYWINNKDQGGGNDNVKLLVKPIAAHDPGKSSAYKLNIYYGTTDILIGTSIIDNTVDCPVENDVTVTVTCEDLKPGDLIVEKPVIPSVICMDTDNPITIYNLRALKKDPNGSIAVGTDKYEVVCDDYIQFILKPVDVPATLTKYELTPTDGYSGDDFLLTFEGYGVATFEICPVIVAGCAAGGTNATGDCHQFTIDIRKPLSADMLDVEIDGVKVNGNLFYRTNGSDPFGPMILTNDELPKLITDSKYLDSNVVMDIIIFDPHGLVGYVAGAADPFDYDWHAPHHDFIGIPIEKDPISLEEYISFPQIYLQNGANTQEPIYVYYALRYKDGFGCCDSSSTKANPPASSGITADCASGEFYIVVKPLDDAINQDLKAKPVQVNPICFADAKPFDVKLNAFYHEKDVFENLAQLPTGVKVSFRIDWVSGDDIIDLEAENTALAASTMHISKDQSGPITWSPKATKAGKGVYMVTPQFNEVMTLTNGIAVAFTLEAQEGLDGDMVGLNGQTLSYANGTVVPAIPLDAELPEGATVTWVLDAGSTDIGSTKSGKNTIPAFTAVNTGFVDVTANYTATITYPGGGCANADATWSITVTPAINGNVLIADVDNITYPVAPSPIAKAAGGLTFNPICVGDDIEITPTATYNGGPAPAQTKLYVEYVSGDDILTFDPTAYVNMGNKFTATGARAGKAIYRIVPELLGTRGVPVLFTVEVREALDAETMVGLYNQTLTFQNGDNVDAIELDALLPEGAVVSWERSGDAIGSTDKGNRYIPYFVAKNTTDNTLTATYTFTIEYADGLGCEDKPTGTLIIKVTPNVVDDLNLFANPVESQTICSGGSFGKIDFTATHINEGDDVDAEFRVEFVSGEQVVELPTDLVEDWTPTVATIGTGVYRVTPIYNNGMGLPATFTLTVLKAVGKGMVGVDGATFAYQNGDHVPAISLDANLPVGAEIKWEVTAGNAASIGLNSTSGKAVVPSFVAVNTTSDPLKVEITFTIENSECDDTGSFTITVAPNTIEDMDLVMNPVEEEAICGAKDAAFGDITFESKRTDGDATFDAEEVKYVVSYVGGTKVVNLTGNNEVTNKAWTPTMALDTDGMPVAGVGTYRVTPYWHNGQGVSVLFTLEVRKALEDTMVGLNGQTLVYKNGDPVESIYLDTQLPEGAKVTWKLEGVAVDIAGVTVESIGSAKAGNRYIPRFNASNPYGKTVKAEYSFEITYPGVGCTADGTFYIEVLPNVIEDLGLVAQAVTPKTVCQGADFEKITFLATLVGTTGYVAADFRIEFVSGNAVTTVPTALVKDWTPKAEQPGTGIYRAVPVYNNKQGVPVTFALTVLETLGADMVGVDGAEFVYQNGDQVPAISLDTNLPADAIVEWTASGDYAAMGLNSKGGNAIVPSFTAVNTGLDVLEATINFTVSYRGDKCPKTGSFTIKVTANTIEDYDLVMNPVDDAQRICNDPEEKFAPIAFTSVRTDGATFTTGNVRYVVSYVGGTNILDLTAGNEVSAQAGTAANWQPTQAYDKFGNPFAGTGTYRVTPYWSNGQGVSVLFTLTVYPVLDNNQIDVQDEQGNAVTFVYNNGDVVPEYNFYGTKVPAGVTIAWEWNNVTGNNQVGSATSGVTRMPSFVAVNTTNKPITAEYIAWLKYEECSTKDDAVKFYITVNPKTILDTDLHIVKLENQTICNGDKFEDVELTVEHRFEDVVLPMTYEYELLSGDNVLGSTEGVLDADCNPYTWEISKFTSALIGTGTYRITPIANNYYGRTAEITLTRLPAPVVNDVDDIELCNGDPLYVEFTSDIDDNTIFNWTATANKVGIPASGSKFINVAKVVNKTNKAEVVTITVTPLVPGTECPGTPIEFKVTVNPVPVADYTQNFAYVHGTKVGKGEANEIKFTGTATAYKWTSSNPTIYENLEGHTSGTVDADANGVAYMPPFTTANYTKEIVTSTVTVTPLYGDCVGEPIQFHILVKSDNAGIILPAQKPQVLCEGEQTEPITFAGFPLEAYYYITWTGGAVVGLDDYTGTQKNSIPAFVAKPGEATVTVVPKVRYNSVEYDGTPLEIHFTVYPKFDLNANISNETEMINIDLSSCQNAGGNTIGFNFDAGIASDKVGNYAYQWYKNGTPIPGEISNTFKRDADKITLADAGEYYCMISSKNGCANDNGDTSVRSKVYKVEIKEVSGDVLVEQLWNDVLQVNCIPSENGGRTYVAFAWFKEDGSKIGEGKSWVQVPDTNAKYYVEASTSDNVYTSCPIALVSVSKVPVAVYVAPSPVQKSSMANVNVSGITEGSIQIVSISGTVVSTAQMTGATTLVSMPNTSGNYIVKVISAEGETAETKVIVK